MLAHPLGGCACRCNVSLTRGGGCPPIDGGTGVL
jgi:hypothetical protein